MTNSTFSKKMCQELLLYEDYLLSCKAVPFKKDMIMVERDKVISLITELRGYHCADRDLKMPSGKMVGGMFAEVADAVNLVAATSEDAPVLSVFRRGNNKQKPEAETGLAEVADSQKKLPTEQLAQSKALAEREQSERLAEAAQAEIAQLSAQLAAAQADKIQLAVELTAAQAEVEQLTRLLTEELVSAQSKMEHMTTQQAIDCSLAEQESARIVSAAQLEGKHRISVAQAENERLLTEAKEQAQFLINDAKIKAELMANEAENRAMLKQEEVDEVLHAKIAETENQAASIIEKASELASAELDTNINKAEALIEAAFQRADNLIEQVERIYAKQLDVVRSDREELTEILNTLQKKRK